MMVVVAQMVLGVINIGAAKRNKNLLDRLNVFARIRRVVVDVGMTPWTCDR